VESLYKKYGDKADFLTIYLEEAHPKDGWALYSNVDFNQPTELEERVAIAKRYETERNVTMKVVVDTMDNNSQLAYSGWPERLFVVVDGIVRYAGGRGPFGYNPVEVDEFLDKFFNS